MCIFSSVLEGSVIWVICPTQSLVPILPHSTLSHSSWHPHLAHHLWAPGLGLWSKWPGWTLVLPLTFLYSSWDSHGKYTGVVCHSLLQWITFCQNSLLWPIRLGWPYTTWLRASSGYASPCSMTRHWSMKGIYSRRIRSRILKRYWHLCLWQHCTTAKRWKQSTIHLWTDEWIKKMWYKHSVGLPWWSSGWESTCWCGDHGFDPCSGKIPHTLGQLSLGCHNYQVSAPSHLCSTREGTEIRSMHRSKK